jgi:pilus assembly protein CpaE
MISHASQNSKEEPDSTRAADDYIAPAPRVSVQAFCETERTATAVRAAGDDRRLAKAHLSVQMGGMAAAIETYHTVPTPNVIILETEGNGDILANLDELATVCDAGTRVVVIGNVNDSVPYRELVRRGVNDYVVGPVETLDVVRSICSLFSASEAITAGRIIAVVGRTVTLELKPEQTETLARARQSGSLSLALRSIADINIVASKADEQTAKRSDSINVIRYGVSTATTTQK